MQLVNKNAGICVLRKSQKLRYAIFLCLQEGLRREIAAKRKNIFPYLFILTQKFRSIFPSFWKFPLLFMPVFSSSEKKTVRKNKNNSLYIRGKVRYPAGKGLPTRGEESNNTWAKARQVGDKGLPAPGPGLATVEERACHHAGCTSSPPGNSISSIPAKALVRRIFD